MLSYQHSYHAGNFADVHKHALLVTVLQTLKSEVLKPMVILDTHAGRGLYDLTGAAAQKIGEFKSGIACFWNDSGKQNPPLQDYLDIVSACNKQGGLKNYAGSSWIIQQLMRKTDSLIAIERHPQEFQALQDCFKNAKNIECLFEDGFAFLDNLIDAPDLVVIDPSYEIKSEYLDVPALLSRAVKKFPHTCFLVWYPMLGARLHRTLLDALHQTKIKNSLVSEIRLEQPPEQGFGMYGSGVVLINPPDDIAAEVNVITQFIAAYLPVPAVGEVFSL
jgi:23S rRNA (adenine2030-N6)-methyltransferase